MAGPRIWFAGDPHGEFRHVVRLALRHRPDAVIFLGDLELSAPLSTVMKPLVHVGVAVHGIHGNHDCDSAALWSRLADDPSFPSFSLDGRVAVVAGVRIGGLGGIFREKVWYPPEGFLYGSYADLEAELSAPWVREDQAKVRASGQWLLHRGSIFPAVYDRLALLRADVLVSHEAPGGVDLHPLGVEEVGELAQMMQAASGFHGHHHINCRYAATGPVRWCGVGYREIVDLDGNTIED